MRVPIRKPGKYTHQIQDAHMTEEKYNKFKADLDRLKRSVRPRLAAEVKRLALMGDFSENAAYQIAKGQLRGINERILKTEDLIKRAVLIKGRPGKSQVGLGHTVTVEQKGQERKYLILGSSETDPTAGIISHRSPIGSALIGRKVGEVVKIKLRDREATLKIIKIE